MEHGLGSRWRRGWWAAGVAVLGLLACEGMAPAQASVVKDGAAEPTAVRVVAVGDVHGDLKATRAVLRLAGLIDAEDHWIGGHSVLVQTGDQLDRGDDERAILHLFVKLSAEAKAAGGRFVVLNGNHETMNVQGDYRYVTEGGLKDFENVAARSSRAAAAPAPLKVRAEAFLPGGTYATLLAERDVIAVVGDSVFVHGGVLPEHVQYGVARLNREVRAWMKGERGMPAVIANPRSPVWTRDYSQEPVSEASCAALARVLKELKVARMVVGHTVQKGGITTACNDRVYRIDVGLAAHYGDGPIEALEITAGSVRILGRTGLPHSFSK